MAAPLKVVTLRFVSQGSPAVPSMSAVDSDDVVTSARLPPGLQAVLNRLESIDGRLLSASEIVTMREANVERAGQKARNPRIRSTIFGIEIGKHWLYPSFQFNDGGQVHEGVGAVLNILPDGFEGWPLLDWFVTPQLLLQCAPAQLLGGATEDIRESNLRRLVALAQYQLLEPLA